MPDAQDVESGLADALTNAFPDTLINRWYTVLEVIDDTGDRGLYLAHSEDLLSWEAQGMLTYALSREQQLMNLELDED